jgi:exodeoxyribonuclease VII small subunit
MDKKISFEEAVKRLEEIVTHLESSDIKLDDMLQLYEEGSGLVKICLSKLDDVEKKINFLSSDEKGSIQESPLGED